MAIKKFKTESKRLLDLMANSIYTNKDIFLRELISNASDALDKRHFMALTDTGIGEDNLHILLSVDQAQRELTVEDNGIGMSKEELDTNLGTIAQSGSLNFKNLNAGTSDIDIIGQFGVGFYSAFMVADRIEVISKKIGSTQAYAWISKSAEGYEIKAAERAEAGTTVKLHLKEDTEDFEYGKYLDKNNLQLLIKKYSDFIRYPIQMAVEVTKAGKEEGKTETSEEVKTLNSLTPLWKKDKKTIKDEEYQDFYMQTFFDYQKPLKTIHYQVEGNISYTALLFIPAKAPYNYYTTDYKSGLKLYSKSVFIKDEANELISDYFRFVRGLIDSDDLNLNISREILQQDYQMNNLKKSIDKRIKQTLEKMLKEERADYEQFFDAFGLQLKYGAYEDYGKNRDILSDLLLFKSSFEDKYVSLKEYVSRMKEGQKEIYYAVGDNIEKIKAMPQIERVLDKGYEVLYFLDNVDEFMATVLNEYESHPYKSINKGDLDLDSAEEKEENKKLSAEHQDLLTAIKSALKDKVDDVRLSKRLKSYPVCLVSDDNLSLEMEKVLNELNGPKDLPKAKRILEINPNHDLFKALNDEYEQQKALGNYAEILYDQALLNAGLTLDDPLTYSQKITELMLASLTK